MAAVIPAAPRRAAGGALCVVAAAADAQCRKAGGRRQGWKAISDLSPTSARTRGHPPSAARTWIRPSCRNRCATRHAAIADGRAAGRQFQPVPAVDQRQGRITALRFVFPPTRWGHTGWRRPPTYRRRCCCRTWRLRGAVRTRLTAVEEVAWDTGVAGAGRRAPSSRVRIGGTSPGYDPRFFARVMGQARSASARATWTAGGMPTSWMNPGPPDWAHLDERVHGWREVADALKARLFNLQAGQGSYEVGRRH